MDGAGRVEVGGGEADGRYDAGARRMRPAARRQRRSTKVHAKPQALGSSHTTDRAHTRRAAPPAAATLCYSCIDATVTTPHQPAPDGTADTASLGRTRHGHGAAHGPRAKGSGHRDRLEAEGVYYLIRSLRDFTRYFTV